MAKFNCLFLMGLIAAAIIGVASAITDDEKNTIRAMAIPMLKSCGEEVGISKEQVLAAKHSKNPEALDSCFYACFFKKTGAINDQGLFDVAAAQEGHKKYIHGEDDLKNLNDIATACGSVNDQPVSDGAKGCDRAKLILHCLQDHKDTFTPLFE